MSHSLDLIKSDDPFAFQKDPAPEPEPVRKSEGSLDLVKASTGFAQRVGSVNYEKESNDHGPGFQGLVMGQEQDELFKAGGHKYVSRKKHRGRWVYDYGKKKGKPSGGKQGASDKQLETALRSTSVEGPWTNADSWKIEGDKVTFNYFPEGQHVASRQEVTQLLGAADPQAAPSPGHSIGETASGKPVYAAHPDDPDSYPSSTGDGGYKQFKEDIKGYSKQDHKDALQHHMAAMAHHDAAGPAPLGTSYGAHTGASETHFNAATHHHEAIHGPDSRKGAMPHHDKAEGFDHANKPYGNAYSPKKGVNYDHPGGSWT